MAIVRFTVCLFFCFIMVFGLPRGTEVLHGSTRPTLNKLREPRSFQSFIQETSRNAVMFAKAAAKTLFPASNSRLGPAGMSRMARATISKIPGKSYATKDYDTASDKQALNDKIKSIKSVTPVISPSPVVAVPSYPVYFYQPGYAMQPFMYYGNTYQAGASKRSFNFPYNFVYNYGQIGGKSADSRSISQVEEKSNPVNLVNKETDGFSEAVIDMKEALITKNMDGGIDMEEKYHDKRVNSLKRSTVKKPKKAKDAAEVFKRVLDSRGSLEKQLIEYLTNYVCGNDC